VVYDLKKYRQHLLGRPWLCQYLVSGQITLRLTYIMKTPEPVSQQGRWLDLLSEYNITIQQPGRVHGNSDALSRRPCERSAESDCQQCPRATRTPMAVPVSSVALLVLPEPLRFLPLHSQLDKSSDLSTTLPPDTASNLLELPVHPVSSKLTPCHDQREMISPKECPLATTTGSTLKPEGKEPTLRLQMQCPVYTSQSH